MNESKRVLLAIVVIGMQSPLSQAQTSSPRPQFEVASVKRNNTCGGRRGGGPRPSPGRLNMECTTLENLIQGAYGAFANGVSLNDGVLEIVGGPAWMESDNYDVATKAEGTARVEQMLGPMMQTLLEDRFKLKIHRDSKEAQVYVLTAAKGGVKLEQTKEGSCVPIDLSHMSPPTPGQPRPNFCGNPSVLRNGSAVTISARGITLERLASGVLSRFLGRQVLDKSGLPGMFDVRLEFTPDNSLPGLAGRGGTEEPGTPPPSGDGSGVSIFNALQQLGLKLEAGKGPVEILVIDHVERPSEN